MTDCSINCLGLFWVYFWNLRINLSFSPTQSCCLQREKGIGVGVHSPRSYLSWVQLWWVKIHLPRVILKGWPCLMKMKQRGTCMWGPTLGWPLFCLHIILYKVKADQTSSATFRPHWWLINLTISDQPQAHNQVLITVKISVTNLLLKPNIPPLTSHQCCVVLQGVSVVLCDLISY